MVYFAGTVNHRLLLSNLFRSKEMNNLIDRGRMIGELKRLGLEFETLPVS
jgi:hypothetical protein